MLNLLNEIGFCVISWQAWNVIRIALFEFKGEMLAFECLCHGNLSHHVGECSWRVTLSRVYTKQNSKKSWSDYRSDTISIISYFVESQWCDWYDRNYFRKKYRGSAIIFQIKQASFAVVKIHHDHTNTSKRFPNYLSLLGVSRRLRRFQSHASCLWFAWDYWQIRAFNIFKNVTFSQKFYINHQRQNVSCILKYKRKCLDVLNNRY